MNRNHYYAFFIILSQLLYSPSLRAQNIDFFAEIDMDAHPNLCPGKVFGDSTTDSGPKGRWSMGTYGPATVYENADIWYVNSMSRFLTPYERDSLGAPPNSFWVQKLLVQENIAAPDYLSRESNRPVNDIGILLDWDMYEEDETISYLAPPYEAGKAYGFFVHIIGMGDDPEAIENTDNNVDNNWAVKKIVWGCTPVSVQDMLGGKDQNTVQLYPNPARDKINFDYTVSYTGNLNITVRTLTGNIVWRQQERIVAAGVQHCSVDVSAVGLSNGLYLLEVNDGRSYASGKFIVNR